MDCPKCGADGVRVKESRRTATLRVCAGGSAPTATTSSFLWKWNFQQKQCVTPKAPIVP